VHSRLKGAFLAIMTFGFLAIAYVMFQMASLSRGAPHAVGGSVGIDVRAIAAWTVRNRVFWLLFVALMVAGSEIVHYWESLFPSGANTPTKARATLPGVAKGTLIGLTSFVLCSMVYIVAPIGNVYAVGSPRFWAGLVASMAFGYYVARSSNRYIWIFKGTFMGAIALVPILVFYLVFRASVAESTASGPGSLRQLTINSPLFWLVFAATIIWACYINKPRSQMANPPATGSLFGAG
jgi:hypothetical protein